MITNDIHENILGILSGGVKVYDKKLGGPDKSTGALGAAHNAKKAHSMSHPIAWYLYLGTLHFFLPVLRELPRDLVEVLLPEEQLDDPRTGILLKENFTVHPYGGSNSSSYSLIVTDQHILQHATDFDNYPHAETRFLCLQHCTDAKGFTIPRAQYSIRAHKMLACPDEKTWSVSRDENSTLCDHLCTLPPHAKEEFAYSGPYHIGEWAEKRHLPMWERRKELEEALGRHLPKDKPVVACFLDEISHNGQLVHGLHALSRHATIIYKTYESNDARLAALGDVVTPWITIDYAPNILRFGADYILAGYKSGTFVTAAMLGLRVLPFYTRIVHRIRRTTRSFCSYKRYIAEKYNHDINNNCQLALGMAYDIQDTQGIMRAMYDPAVWEAYAARLPEAQKRAFGDYCIEGAAQKTALLILKAFHRGTFGKDASAVRVRPEWLESQGTSGMPL